jgi:hypothetical protein
MLGLMLAGGNPAKFCESQFAMEHEASSYQLDNATIN